MFNSVKFPFIKLSSVSQYRTLKGRSTVKIGLNKNLILFLVSQLSLQYANYLTKWKCTKIAEVTKIADDNHVWYVMSSNIYCSS